MADEGSDVEIVGCDAKSLKKAAGVVKNGGLVVYPTDTVYGLGCKPFDEEALNRVYSAKQRTEKPLPVLCSSLRKVAELVHLGEIGFRLANVFWPGPLTIVAPLKDSSLSSKLTCGESTLGVRIPRHDVALMFIDLCGEMLVGTSANRSGLPPPRNPGEVFMVLPSGFDILIDGGSTPVGVESTVIILQAEGWRILREGAVGSVEVKRALA